MEDQAGQDLGWFFDQWLKRPGTPVVEGTWTYDAAAKAIDVTLTQTQAGEPYRLPLEIGIALPDATPMKVEQVEFRRQQQTFRIATAAPPTNVVLDPNTWVLMKADLRRR
jgi:aminopeptidase N